MQNSLADFATIYRSDNDDGTGAFFDANKAVWVEGLVPAEKFHHIFSKEEAKIWLDNEIKTLESDGIDASDYHDLLTGEQKNPVVSVLFDGKFVLWDGYHRVAAAIINDRDVLAVYAQAP